MSLGNHCPNSWHFWNIRDIVLNWIIWCKSLWDNTFYAEGAWPFGCERSCQSQCYACHAGGWQGSLLRHFWHSAWFWAIELPGSSWVPQSFELESMDCSTHDHKRSSPVNQAEINVNEPHIFVFQECYIMVQVSKVPPHFRVRRVRDLIKKTDKVSTQSGGKRTIKTDNKNYPDVELWYGVLEFLFTFILVPFTDPALYCWMIHLLKIIGCNKNTVTSKESFEVKAPTCWATLRRWHSPPSQSHFPSKCGVTGR